MDRLSGKHDVTANPVNVHGRNTGCDTVVKHLRETLYHKVDRKKVTGKKKRKIRRIYREKGKYDYEEKIKKMFVW